MSYHPDNLKLQPFDHASVVALSEHAARLGIQFKIGGIPFGAPHDQEAWGKFWATEAGSRVGVNSTHAAAGENAPR